MILDLNYSQVFADETESVGSVQTAANSDFQFEGYDIVINEKTALMPLKNI